MSRRGGYNGGSTIISINDPRWFSRSKSKKPKLTAEELKEQRKKAAENAKLVRERQKLEYTGGLKKAKDRRKPLTLTSPDSRRKERAQRMRAKEAANSVEVIVKKRTKGAAPRQP